MKKLVSLLLGIAVLATFTFFAVASGDDDSEAEATQAAGSAVADENANSTLGDYKVDIKDARITKNYENKPVVVIKYGFTNNSDKSACFAYTFEDTAYQNGVGLTEAYVLTDADAYDENNQYKEIKKGVTLDVEVAYILNDTETDVTVEVSEIISFSDDVISKTFSIK